MKSTLGFLLALLMVSGINGQLYNNGGSIFISEGATLFCSGNATNASGTLTNNGRLEVQGNFLNSGTYSGASSDDSLILSGPAAATVNTGGASIGNLLINKTGGGTATLLANLDVVKRFDLVAGSFSTDPATTFELAAPTSAQFSFAAGTAITGKVRRTGWTNGAAQVFNAAHMQVTTNGGTPPTSVMVSMVPNGDPTGAEREVKRTFAFSTAGGTGFTADVRFPYAASELNTNVAANLQPWHYTSAVWNRNTTNNTVNITNNYVTATTLPAALFTASQWKLADPLYTFNVEALLAGPWNSGTQLMNTNLNSNGIIPLTQPYNTSNFNYAGAENVAAIPNGNVVDWVLLELRKPASSLPADATAATIVGRKAVFILNNGTLADLNGAAAPLVQVDQQGTAFIVVRHRNHLAAMSNAVASNAAGTFANNFRVLANVYKNPSNASNPVMPLSGSTLYGLWGGDANRNNAINAVDVNALRAAIAGGATGYQFADVNLSGGTNAIDVNFTRTMLTNGGSSSVQARGTGQRTTTLETSVP